MLRPQYGCSPCSVCSLPPKLPHVLLIGGTCVDVRLRQEQMQVDDAGVRRERARLVARGRVELLRLPRLLVAELRRAEVRQRLDGVEPVGAAEEREEVLAVIGEDRQLALLRQLPGEDRRDGVLGVRVHRRRAAVPRRVPCERRRSSGSARRPRAALGSSARSSGTRRRRSARPASSSRRRPSWPSPARGRRASTRAS